jgi:hypothetical protein
MEAKKIMITMTITVTTMNKLHKQLQGKKQNKAIIGGITFTGKKRVRLPSKFNLKHCQKCC